MAVRASPHPLDNPRVSAPRHGVFGTIRKSAADGRIDVVQMTVDVDDDDDDDEYHVDSAVDDESHDAEGVADADKRMGLDS
jgi:hypothetical protein